MDTKDIDWNSSVAIIEAAKPFDRSYDPSKPVMLAESELVSFVRHYWAPRSNAGRRASDGEAATKLAQLEQENADLKADLALVQSEAQILRHRLIKDRRQEDVPVSFDRRGRIG